MKQLRIDMLSPAKTMVVLPPPPDGVRMSGLRSDPTNGPIGDSLFVIVDVSKDVGVGLLSAWIYDRVIQYRAKRHCINGREPKDGEDFKRIVTEELEIGKND